MAAMDLVSVILCLTISLCTQINAYDKFSYKNASHVCPQGSIFINATKNSVCPQNNKYTLVEGENLCIRIFRNRFIKVAWFEQIENSIRAKIIYSQDNNEFTVTFDTKVTVDFKDGWTYNIVSSNPCLSNYPSSCINYEGNDYFTLKCDLEFRVLSPPLIEVSNTTLKPIASKRTEEQLQQNLYLFYKYAYTPGTKKIKILYNNVGADKPKTEWVLEPPRTASIKRQSGTDENYGKNCVLEFYERDNNTFLTYTFDGNGIKIHVNITFVTEPVSDPPTKSKKKSHHSDPPTKSKNKSHQYKTSPKKTTTPSTTTTKAPTTTTTTEINLIFQFADGIIFPMTVNGETKEEDFELLYEKDREINITCHATITIHDHDRSLKLLENEEFYLYICELKANNIVKRLDFPPAGPIRKESVTNNIAFNADETYNGKTILCAVLKARDVKNYQLRKSVKMLMIKKERNEITTDSPISPPVNDTISSANQDGEAGLPWFWYAVIGGVCVMLMLIVALINMILKHSKKRQPSSYENFTSDDAPNFPNTATLEETYCTPSDNKSNEPECMYSLPFKTKDPADLYSVPIPKHQRDKNKDKKDALYAELTFDEGNDNSLYSEIAPKPSKKNFNPENKYASIQEIKQELNAKVLSKAVEENDDYINVFDNETYVNSKTSKTVHSNDYDDNEPNYCEVKPWH